MRRWPFSFLLSSALLCGSLTVAAEVDDMASTLMYKPPTPERRSDLMVSVLMGAQFGALSGYPNDVRKIDDPDFAEDSGTAFGGGGTLLVGGALRDWFVFGIGATSTALEAQTTSTRGGAFVMHVETYPLYPMGGVLRDLGVFADFGAGSLAMKRGDDRVADGGNMSLVGGGLVYEPWAAGSFRFGPALAYQRMFSQSLNSDTVTVALRAAFYGGP